MYSAIFTPPSGILALPIVQWLNVVLGITMLVCIFLPTVRSLVFQAIDAVLGHITNLSLASVSSKIIGGLASLAAKPAVPPAPSVPTADATKTTS